MISDEQTLQLARDCGIFIPVRLGADDSDRAATDWERA